MLEQWPAIISAVVVVLAFIISNVVLAVKLTRKLSDVEMALRAKIDEQPRAMERLFGETIAAVREKMNLDAANTWAKITEVELYVRDHFVRQGSFSEAIQNLHDQIDNSTKRIEDRMERLEDKLNSVKKQGT